MCPSISPVRFLLMINMMMIDGVGDGNDVDDNAVDGITAAILSMMLMIMLAMMLMIGCVWMTEELV
jgi:hypothetical protein